MKKTILVFSLVILGIILLFKLSTYSLNSGDISLEIALGIIAVVFFFVGLRLKKLNSPVTLSNHLEIDKARIKSLEITPREYEVLLAISEGLSNKEIAERLYLSESTIKTHVSNLLIKLGAKRRTQALQVAKKEKII